MVFFSSAFLKGVSLSFRGALALPYCDIKFSAEAVATRAAACQQMRRDGNHKQGVSSLLQVAQESCR